MRLENSETYLKERVHSREVSVGTVSIIIPTINEEIGIGATLDGIPISEILALGVKLEVIVVDGGSKDNTIAIAKSKGAKIVIEPRRGYGRAYKTGFLNSSGEFIVLLDGDGTYIPHQQYRTS